MSNGFSLDDSTLEALLGNKPDFSNSGLSVSKEEEAKATIHRLSQLSDMLDRYEEARKLSGMQKWFVPGTPFSIDKCPKHKAFFESGAQYGQRLFMAANRVGKSVSGALESAYHATG